MATDNTLRRGTFGLLPEPEGRMGSFGLSMVINVVVGAMVLLLTIAQVHQVQQERKYETTQLIFPVPQPKPYVPPAPQMRQLPPPPVVQDKPRIELPHELPPPPKVAEIKMPTPEMPKIEAAPPKRFEPPPAPKVGMFKSETPTEVANNKAAPSIHTGGFGDPQGVHPNANADRQATVAALGSFDAAPGTRSGAGAARQGTVHGVDFGSGVADGVPGGRDRGAKVASAGFGEGVLGGTGRPGSHGTVARGNFSDNMYGSGPGPTVQPHQPDTTPIVVLVKPLPTYTAEARQLKIEGDVTLEVRFEASGQVQVLRVINGLGHGLDEQARLAAEHIRFKPATRDGHPVDEVSIIHVTFQMA